MQFYDLELKMWLTQTFFSKIIRGYINADFPFFLLEEEVSCIMAVANLNTQNCQKNAKMLDDDWNSRRWLWHMQILFLKVYTEFYAMIFQTPFGFIWNILLYWDRTHKLKRGDWNKILSKRKSLLVNCASPSSCTYLHQARRILCAFDYFNEPFKNSLVSLNI